MRKNKAIVILTLLVIVGFAFQSLSAEQKSLSKKPMTAKAGTETAKSGVNNIFAGKVIKVNAKESTLTVSSKTEKNPLTVAFDSQTLFYKGGKVVTITALKKGDPVRLDYEVKGGRNLARVVRAEETKKK
ncbi:MAG: hypothetical protein HYS56_03175 [Candidatus Omnitrophica bacterium]|nr:hypothetical protein [Candidatus Omnitrophota bacterium]